VLTETLKGNYFKASELAKELSLSLSKLTKKKQRNKLLYTERLFFVAEILLGLGEKSKAISTYQEVIKQGNKFAFVKKAQERLNDIR
jgi:TolA-binding protein